MRTFRTLAQSLMILVFGLAALTGCSGGDSEKAAEVSVSPQALTLLAAADQVDGSQDMVVSKCAGCALHMDGMQEHALKMGDYEMHFCTDACKGRFAEKGEEAILSMEIPEE